MELIATVSLQWVFNCACVDYGGNSIDKRQRSKEKWRNVKVSRHHLHRPPALEEMNALFAFHAG